MPETVSVHFSIQLVIQAGHPRGTVLGNEQLSGTTRAAGATTDDVLYLYATDAEGKHSSRL